MSRRQKEAAARELERKNLEIERGIQNAYQSGRAAERSQAEADAEKAAQRLARQREENAYATKVKVEKRRGFVGIEDDPVDTYMQTLGDRSGFELGPSPAQQHRIEREHALMAAELATRSQKAKEPASGSGSAEVTELRETVARLAASAAQKEDLEELKLAVARDLLKVLEGINSLAVKVETILAAAPPVPAVSAAPPLLEEVKLITKRLDDERDERERLRKERIEREERDQAAKAARKKREAEEKSSKAAVRKERNRRRKDAKKQKASRRKEIRLAKEKGENPYSEAETKAYVAKLEKAGKTYYTPEQRAAYKASLPPKDIVSKGREAGKAEPKARKVGGRKRFVAYTAEQKAQFVKENFTDKGKKYYTLAERRRYQKTKKGTGVPSNAPPSK